MSSSADTPDEKTVAIRGILKSNPTNKTLAVIAMHLGKDVAGIAFAYLGRDVMSWDECGQGILTWGNHAVCGGFDIRLIEDPFESCFWNIRRCIERKGDKYRNNPSREYTLLTYVRK